MKICYVDESDAPVHHPYVIMVEVLMRVNADAVH